MYLLKNNANGKQYVGKTGGVDVDLAIKKRWGEHVSLALAGGGYVLHKAIRKHGADQFDIFVLATCETNGEALAEEMRQIAVLSPAYNLTGGGEGALISVARRAAQANGEKTYIGRPCQHGHQSARYTSTRQCCECHRQRHLNAMGGVALNKKWRWPMPDERKQRISQAMTGVRKTPEHARNISLGRKARFRKMESHHV